MYTLGLIRRAAIAACGAFALLVAVSSVSIKRLSNCCVYVVVAALVLTGCNANQAINPSEQADRCANDAGCDPYNPISYAQNNTGNAGGGGR